ncbi:MAG: tetratricopeptide repeat protein [Myxococcota bacterium]
MDAAYQRFEATLLQGKLDQAEALARHLLAQHPTDERAHVAVARVVAARGRLDAAVAHLEALEPVARKLPHALAHLALLWHAKGEDTKAMDYALRSVKTGEEVPAALRLLGDDALRHREYDEAASWFGSALRVDPSDVDAWKGLAKAHKKLKREAAAVQALEHVVAARPNDPNSWLDLISARLDCSDVEGARTNIAQALKLHARNSELLQLANNVRQMGTTTTDPLAREIAGIRELLDRGDRDAAVTKLATLTKLHRMTRALKFVQAELQAADPRADIPTLAVGTMKLVTEYPEAWEPRALLADMLLRRTSIRNVKQALTHAEEAWHMSGGDPRVGLQLIRVYQATGKAGVAQVLGAQLRAIGPEVAARVDQLLGPPPAPPTT